MPIMIEDQELMALLAVILQGKFQGTHLDTEVPASPLVASVARRVAEAVKVEQIERSGESMRDHHATWEDLARHPDQWASAVNYARRFFAKGWQSYTPDRQLQLVDDLVAPFKLTLSDRRSFVRAFTAADPEEANS